MNNQNNKNLILATSLSVIILISWTWFYEKPRLEKVALEQKKIQENSATNTSASSIDQVNAAQSSPTLKNAPDDSKIDNIAFKNRQEVIQESNVNRIKISSPTLHGSINLKGARFDDLTLAKYFKKADKKDEVVLFSPAKPKNATSLILAL